MEIKPLLVRFRRTDDTLKEVTAERKEAHEALLHAMQEQGITTVKGEDGPDDIQGTYVGGTIITIDEERLRKELGAKVFNSLTSPVLDKAKLEEAIAQGVVDPIVVARCSTEKARAPYVRLSVRKNVRVPVKTRKPTSAGRAVKR